MFNTHRCPGFRADQHADVSVGEPQDGVRDVHEHAEARRNVDPQPTGNQGLQHTNHRGQDEGRSLR